MDQRPGDRPRLPPGVPRAQPVRVVRARWSARTLWEIGLIQAGLWLLALAGVALLAWIAWESWAWAPRRRLPFVRIVNAAFAGLVGLFLLWRIGLGLWRAGSMLRDARRRARER